MTTNEKAPEPTFAEFAAMVTDTSLTPLQEDMCAVVVGAPPEKVDWTHIDVTPGVIVPDDSAQVILATGVSRCIGAAEPEITFTETVSSGVVTATEAYVQAIQENIKVGELPHPAKVQAPAEISAAQLSAAMKSQSTMLTASASEHQVNAANQIVLKKAAQRSFDKAMKRPKASPLLNSLIGNVVKETKQKNDGMRWEQLTSFHNQLAMYLYSTSMISDFMRNEPLCSLVADKAHLLKLTMGLIKDLDIVNKRMKANREQYSAKNGAVVSDEDHFLAFGIYDEYISIQLDIVNSLMPVSDEIMEIFTVAEKLLISLQEKAKLEHPSVTIDPAGGESVTTSTMVEILPDEQAAVIDTAVGHQHPDAIIALKSSNVWLKDVIAHTSATTPEEINCDFNCEFTTPRGLNVGVLQLDDTPFQSTAPNEQK